MTGGSRDREEGDREGCLTRAETLAADYIEARRLASRREFASVLDQIAFLTVMAVGQPEIAKGLERLREKLL